MSKTIIKVENLGKKYLLGERQSYYSLRDSVSSLFSKNKKSVDEFWALKDVNFEVKQGESVGIIGRNGAGKSTLLKILSRITPPTTGKITLDGRVASLLEVGTGFNPELTGRENIFLNGAILGMKQSEIKRKFDEIVAFSEVEKFLDMPVKHYSSGMYMRLAFAVAAHLESEILIVDEVLAVGDAQFQKKCLGKMGEVTKNEGRTVLFVSHNMGAIRRLCNKSIMLSSGKIFDVGDTNRVIEKYTSEQIDSVSGYWKNVNKLNQLAYLCEIFTSDNDGNIRNSFLSSEVIYINFVVQIVNDINNLKVGFDLIKNDEVVFRSQQVDSGITDSYKAGTTVSLVCELPKRILNFGEYSIYSLFTIHCEKTLADYNRVVSFTIDLDLSSSKFHSVLTKENHPGVIFPILSWHQKNVK